MGLAASQARFLNLTGRLSYVQRQGQQVNQERAALASKMNQALQGNNSGNQAAQINPFFAGAGGSPEFFQSKNSNNKSNNNNNNNQSQSSSFGSLMSSLISAASQYPGANKSPMQIDSAQLASIQAEDKRLELLLRTLDTQEQCLKTEISAVQKVIDKNIDTSFKLMA
ncbi:MAG: hypothetical protein AB1782_00670 [Cyanobacteriota bacterium]